MNLPLTKLGNQNVIIDYEIVISKKGDFKTIGVRNLYMCESVCVRENFFKISHLEIGKFCDIGKKVLAQSRGKLERAPAISIVIIDN